MPRSYKRRMRKMGYGTRYYSSRKYPGLYRSTNRYTLAGAALKRIGRYKLRQAIKSVAEKKFFDSALQLNSAGNILSLNGYFFTLTDVPQGPGQSNRVGDKCTGSSLEIRYTLTSPFAVATSAYLTFRMIIFVWKDDTVPVVADILEPIGGITPPDAPFRFDSRVKRKILYDGTHTQYAESVTKNAQNPIKFKKIILPLNKLRRGLNTVNFQGGTTTAINHIYALLISDTPNVANQTWSLDALFRYTYIDM